MDNKTWKQKEKLDWSKIVWELHHQQIAIKIQENQELQVLRMSKNKIANLPQKISKSTKQK